MPTDGLWLRQNDLGTRGMIDMLTGVVIPTPQHDTGRWPDAVKRRLALLIKGDGSGWCVRIHHHQHPDDVRWLIALHPKTTIVLRWYWLFGDERPALVLDAKKYADWHRSLRETIQWLRDNGVAFVLELDNEPNIEWPSGTTPEAFLDWWKRNVEAIKHEFPSVKILMPALSPGPTEATWWQVLRAQGEAADGACVHDYWQNGDVLFSWLIRKQTLHANTRNWLTEIANTELPAGPMRASQYVFAVQRLANDGAEAACIWLLWTDSDNSDFQREQLSDDECSLIGEGIAEWRKQQKEERPMPEFGGGIAEWIAAHPNVNVGLPTTPEIHIPNVMVIQATTKGKFEYYPTAVAQPVIHFFPGAGV